MEYLDKVRTLRQAQSQFLPIEIDGGINDQTITIGKKAGATRFVTTSFLFNSEDPSKQYQILQDKLGMGVRKNG